jgi:CheY-like chemotaxis protein
MAKILVIDDDALVCETIADILQDAGHTTVVARDGREGLAEFEAEKPALTITDLIMPEQEGIETIRRIRQLCWDAKIICISGGGRSVATDYLSMAAKLGASATLAKPFHPADLVDLVDRLLCARP